MYRYPIETVRYRSLKEGPTQWARGWNPHESREILCTSQKDLHIGRLMPDDAARVNETEPPSSMLTDSQAKLLGFRRHRARRDPFAAASVMTMRPHQAGLESKVHPTRQSDDRSKMRPEKDRDVQDDAVGALAALRARLANVEGERDLLERQLQILQRVITPTDEETPQGFLPF